MPTNTDGLIELLVEHDASFGLYKKQHWTGVVSDALVPWLEEHDQKARRRMLLPDVTRVEVIDNDGRVFSARYSEGGVDVHLQDDERTIKVFAGESTGTPTDRYRAPYERLQRELASPPAGWFPFGHHVDGPPEQELEFWGRADDGMPLWERPSDSERRHELAYALEQHAEMAEIADNGESELSRGLREAARLLCSSAARAHEG